MTDPDVVDHLVDQWRRERPDLDGEGLDAMATIARLGRLAAVAGPLVDRVFARHGLRTGEFDVLAALRRSGEPFVLTPSELARAMMLSAAAMTNRLDRLEAGGHVDRRLDPDNRRSILVSLTDSGRALVDDVVTEHVRNERALLSSLGPDDRRTLDDLLRRLLSGLEGG